MCVAAATGAPVTAEPGESPSWALSIVGPVFVTVEPPSTEKFLAVPSPTGAASAARRYGGEGEARG